MVFPHRILTAAALLACSFAAGATCYTVNDKAGKILYQSVDPPVDMSRELHETVPARFGAGSSMVFMQRSDDCPGIGSGASRYTGATTGYMAGGMGQRTFNADYLKSGNDAASGFNASTTPSMGSGFGNKPLP